MAQNNIGTALRTLGMREDDPARLVAAVQAHEAALGGYTRIWPLQRAMTQENIAIAELALAQHAATADSKPHLTRALGHVTSALEVYDPVQTQFYYDKAVRLRDQVQAALAGG